MTYIVDTHILIWFLDKNNRLKPQRRQILINKGNNFVFPAIVLADIKRLISIKRINIDFDMVLEYLSESETALFTLWTKTLLKRCLTASISTML